MVYFFYLGVIGHNGYASCLKCVTEGEYCYSHGKMIFPELNAALRTDSAFRSRTYEGHHKHDSILEEITRLDMIKDFPIGDALHLIDLGITKRFLVGWKSGILGNQNARWSAAQIQEISNFLKLCKLPKEIQRPLRGLENLPRWKGTEFRTFLLYASIVVVTKFFTSKEIIDHFLHFFCAIQICSRQNQSINNYKVARCLIKDFLEGVKILYGDHMFCSNLHSLIHLVDDVERFGPLGKFDAYPFESKLFCIKNLIRSGNKPLSQVAKRIIEIQQNVNVLDTSEEDQSPQLIAQLGSEEAPQELATLINEKQLELYAGIKIKNFCINSKHNEDSWIISKLKNIFKITLVLHDTNTGNVLLYGKCLSNQFDFFTTPLRSSSLLIYASNLELGCAKLLPLSDLLSKMVSIETRQKSLPKCVFLPLIHSLM